MSQLLAQFEEESTREPYIQIPSAELCNELGISTRHDYVALRPAEERELNSLHAEIDATWTRYAHENRFADGFWKIRTYIPRLGRPTSVRRIRNLAQVRHHSAWFLVHGGQARSALDQATRAIALSLKAYAESDDRTDLALVAESALVAAMAYQLRNQPQSSRKILDLAEAARKSSAQKESPEYFRQCGVVCLQLGEDDRARREFQAAMARARDAGDITFATAEMMGARQMHLLGIPDWDRAQEFLVNTTRVFPEGTLQYSINANWTAATGIATGSAKVAAQAMELLERAE